MNPKSDLRKRIVQYFKLDELRDLCQDLAIDHEEFPQNRKSSFVRELVDECDRHGRLHALIAYCREARPHVDWPSAPASSTTSFPATPWDYPSVDFSSSNKKPPAKSKKPPSPSPKNSPNVDYTRLIEMLRTKNWRAADSETEKIILKFQSYVQRR